MTSPLIRAVFALLIALVAPGLAWAQADEPYAPGNADEPPPSMAGPQPMQGPPPSGGGSGWGAAFDFSLSHLVPMGDKNFGLRQTLGASGVEFESATGIDFFIGARTPRFNVDIGFRFGIGFGPLNTDAWATQMGVDELGNSALMNLGLSARWSPLEDSFVRPYVGAEALFTNLGTSSSGTHTVCDANDICEDVEGDMPHVSYSGFTIGYLGGIRVGAASEKRWWFFAEGRYLQTSWFGVDVVDGKPGSAPTTDIATMGLNHVSIQLGFGASM